MERPILFSAPMVRAILDGSKTQTRRVIKPQPNSDGLANFWEVNPPPCEDPHDCGYWINSDDERVNCPYGDPGDRLWVRETHGFYDEYPVSTDDVTRFSIDSEWLMRDGNQVALAYWRKRIVYRADPSAKYGNGEPEKWRPSIFMPRWASRITIEITGVRVERLQDISEKDALAEGVDWNQGASKLRNRGCKSAREAYSVLWESINGKGSWSANPWVWIVEFKRP